MVAFGAALRAVGVLGRVREKRRFVGSGLRLLAGPGVGVDGGEDVEGRWSGGSGGDACGFEDGFELAGADDGVDFRDVFLDFVAIALDEAAGDDELARAACGFVASHFEDGVDRLLLGGVDEGAGVDDEDFGFFRAGGETGAGAVEQAHHDLGIDEVFGAAEGDKSHGGGRFCVRFDSLYDCTGRGKQGTGNRE